MRWSESSRRRLLRSEFEALDVLKGALAPEAQGGRFLRVSPALQDVPAATAQLQQGATEHMYWYSGIRQQRRSKAGFMASVRRRVWKRCRWRERQAHLAPPSAANLTRFAIPRLCLSCFTATRCRYTRVVGAFLCPSASCVSTMLPASSPTSRA